MIKEINPSIDSLSRKYSISINNLNHNDLLAKRNGINTMDADFNDVLSKITELVRGLPSSYNIRY